MKYYTGALIFTALATLAGFFMGGPAVALLILLLGLLETSLSFDNAVVNASVLRNWEPHWRKRFITFGLPVAVLGMRLAFPLIIVAVIAQIGPAAVIHMAISNPDKYAATLSSAHAQVAAFGGAFLAMIFLNFFLDQEKDSYWLSWLEKPLQKLGNLESIQIVITLATVYGVSKFQAPGTQLSFIAAGIAGLITYILAESFGSIVGGEDAGKQVIKQGLVGLLYLELLDASFSFDGVMGSFAISNAIFVIALGLGVGAMFVRSMTLHLVDKGTLNEYPYLESGAFWAIGALTCIMFISSAHHVSEVVSGLIGAGFIIAALVSSIIHNHRESTVST
jgi:hypothetical protein